MTSPPRSCFIFCLSTEIKEYVGIYYTFDISAFPPGVQRSYIVLEDEYYMSVLDSFLETCLDLNIQVTNVPLEHELTSGTYGSATKWYMYRHGVFVGTFTYSDGLFDVDIENIGQGQFLPVEVVQVWLDNWVRYFAPTGHKERILREMLQRMCDSVSELLTREDNLQIRQIIIEEKQRIEDMTKLQNPSSVLGLLTNP